MTNYLQPQRSDCSDPQAEGAHSRADWTDGEDRCGGAAADPCGGAPTTAAAAADSAPATDADAADDDERAGAADARAPAHVHAAGTPG